MSRDRQRGRRPDTRALVAKLSDEGARLLGRELLAPCVRGGRIRTRVGGLVYELVPTRPFVGWGRFRPVSEREAEPVGEALPWERGAYLELFPALRVVLLWPDPKVAGTWWALPYNESDARKRFGLSGEPVPVRLCDPLDGAQAFERVMARVDGRALWFDGPDALADSAQAEWLRDAVGQEEAPDRLLPGLAGSQKLALLYAQVRGLELARADERLRELQALRGSPRERLEWLRRTARADRLQEQLRHALAKADAELLGYTETSNADGTPAGLVVEWRERTGATGAVERRYRSLVSSQLSVVSSGICLSGRDRDFDLTSLVSVVARRPDWMDEEEEW